MRTSRWLLAAGVAYVVLLAINRSVVQVRGPSMEPALWPGDRLLTVPAHRAWLRPGQVVVVEDPEQPGHLVVKRVHDLGRSEVDVRGDAADRSTDSRRWGRLPVSAIRRVAVARWPDLRTPLRWHTGLPADR